MYRTDFWTLWEKARVGCFKRTASKHVYYLGWNRPPAQVGCMRQVLRPGVLGRPRGIGWRGRWEGGLGWGIHVYPWLIHVSVWQKPLQYCKVISLQLIKKNNNICAQFKSEKAHKSTQWKVSLPLLPFSSHAGALTKDNHSFQFPMYSSRYSITYFLPQMGSPLVATLSDPKVIPSSKHCQVPLETLQTGQPGDTVWPCKRFHRGTDFLWLLYCFAPWLTFRHWLCSVYFTFGCTCSSRIPPQGSL